MRTSKAATSLILAALPAAVILTLASCGRSAMPTSSGADGDDRVALSFAPKGGGSSQSGNLFAGQAVVVLKPGANKSQFESRNQVGELDRTTIAETTYILVQSTNGEPDIIRQLEGDPALLKVIALDKTWGPGGTGEPMSFDDGGSVPSSAEYRTQGVLSRIRLPEAVAISNGTGVVIAILDSGIDSDHPAFVEGDARFILGSDWTVGPRGQSVEEARNGRDDDRDSLIDEGYGHGTHVAGIVHLAAPGAKLMIIKVLNDDGFGSTFGLASGIMEAIEGGADVINLSLGLLADDVMISAAVTEAARQGVAVIASAGNRGTSVPQFPAAYDWVLCVAAVDLNDVFWEHSNGGRIVDLTAPGVGVVSLLPADHPLGPYAAGQGTSFSAPFVTGATAAVMAHMTTLSSRDAAIRVRDHAENIDAPNPMAAFMGSLGTGRIDMTAPLGP